ncbi:MAG: radical SAM protein [Negativicutes bacterium]|nr:radical SAM protein [Negativicutes bacterium]
MYENLDIARLKYIMTMDCNFRCDYCFEGGKSNKNLNVNEAIVIGKQVLDEMTQNKLTILYFGGEPLLRFFDVQAITSALTVHAKKIDKDIQFTIITNGSILTPLMTNHFKRYKYFVSVSCDGIAAAQDEHRGYKGYKKSFDRVLSTIKILNSETKDLCISMVATKHNVKYLVESFKFFLEEVKINNFAISPVLDKQQYTPDPEEYKEQLMRLADLAANCGRKIVLNPPLDKPWEEDNVARKMAMTSKSVNIEITPLEVKIVKEVDDKLTIDYGTHAKLQNNPASKELRLAIIGAEKEAQKYYIELQKERI